VRYPTDPAQLAQITRAARQLPRETWDAFFTALGKFFVGLDDAPGRLPSPADVAAAIEHGLAAIEEGYAPIPLTFAQALDGRKRPPRDTFAERSLKAAIANRGRHSLRR
jgi:hypothetical protein